MDDYAGRVLADRYRLPLPPSDEYELAESRAFDTYSGQEVLVRQVPLPEVVEAEVLDAEGLPEGFTARGGPGRRPPGRGASTRRPVDPAVRRAVEAAQAAARIPDHPRLDQVFDVFAEGGSLWIVSELVPARPLAALLAEQPLTPYRAAEVASDVLMALKVLHAHGWVHRNVTARTVLVCDDGRVMLTGLAVGAAEEALCGYDPVPPPEGDDGGPGGPGVPSGGAGVPGTFASGSGGAAGGAPPLGQGRAGAPGGALPPAGHSASAGHTGGLAGDPEAARRAAIEARAAGGLPVAGGERAAGSPAVPARRAPEDGGDIRAARAGAIAAYRAGARAAARVQETQGGRTALPGARPAPESEQPSGPPGQIADPYGVRDAGRQVGPGPAAAGALPPAAPRGQGPSAGYGPSAGHGGGYGAGAPAQGVPGQGFTAQGMPGQGVPGQGAAGQGVPAPGMPAPGMPAPGTTAPGVVAHGMPAPGMPGPGATGPEVVPHGVPAQGGPASVEVSGARGAGSGRWDEPDVGVRPVRRGPATALAAERARQARMAVVGPVTERWAPEQAGPVHENWQLAAPIGPATDLWALGALLFRSVQGHAPYPEESTAELVQMVCGEPPAFAEECGPLRPVVESLLRQDPTERIDFEELRGWLRSLVRSAPEPEAGVHVVAAPPAGTGRLPVVRRRGELVRRRKAGLPATHGRHKRGREENRAPRRLGRTLLVLVLLAMAGAIAYAALFLPKAGEEGQNGASGTDRTGAAGGVSEESARPDASSEPRPDQTTPGGEGEDTEGSTGSGSTGSAETQTAGPDVADGFTLRNDPEGFRVAVANGWDRTPENGRGQVVYTEGSFELILVPGRDSAAEFGSDPMEYQREREPELQPYRDSTWAVATGLKSIEVGGRSMAEGQFTWTGDDDRELFVRNLAILVDGRYHVVQVRGPEAERDEVTRLYEQAAATYQVTG
ncbi:protein kinase [Streptomyces sp. NPDC093252]|uniref:protein kinase n=1 Tax=Streptomyces sp. NPDC093252 TaxID=3154980 RepID=UPI00342D5408